MAKYISVNIIELPRELHVECLTGDDFIRAIQWLEGKYKGYEFVYFYQMAVVPFFILRLKPYDGYIVKSSGPDGMDVGDNG